MERQRTSMRRSVRPVVIVACLAVLMPPAVATAEGQPAIEGRVVSPKPRHHEMTASDSSTRLHVKFVEGSSVRVRWGRFQTEGDDDLRGLQAALARVPGAVIHRLFTRPEADLAADEARIERLSGREQADLRLWYRLVLPEGSDMVSAVDALNALDIVEFASPEPLPAALPTSPDFGSLQDYRGPAPNGVDGDWANYREFSAGNVVKVFDLEYGWDTNHEDLPAARAPGAYIPNGHAVFTEYSEVDHGTKVLGVMSAHLNGTGMTGIAPFAELHLVNVKNTERGYDLANSIDIAHDNMGPGDVMLIEQQFQVPAPGCGANNNERYVPVEYHDPYYDAIVSATSDGIYVVEPAGNGGQNLDLAPCGPNFPKGKASSQAIIVGAAEAPGCGAGPPRSRAAFSTFGSRVDVQGWGECVATTGGGTLWGAHPFDDDAYTAAFSGTSSASPMVAATAVWVSDAREKAGLPPLSPSQMRAMLAAPDNSTPQDVSSGGALSGNIGPQPDLASLLRGMSVPRNNDFGSARTLTERRVSVGGDNVLATDQAGEPNHAGTSTNRSVWFTWQPADPGTVVLDTRGSRFDTVLAVYTGTAVNALTLVAASDDEGGGVTTSRVSFSIVRDQNGVLPTLRIAVDGRSGAAVTSGAYVLNAVLRPVNDDFAAATVLNLGFSVLTRAQSIIGATYQTGEPLHADRPGGTSIWYRWTSPATPVRVELDTAGSWKLSNSIPLDTLLAVYTGSAVNALTPVVSNDDDGALRTSRVAFASQPGTTYHFAVDGYSGDPGSVILHAALRPVNDPFASAQALAGRAAVVEGSNVGGTKETGEPNHAGAPGGNSVWYSWLAPATGSAVAATTDSASANFDTLLAVYTGSTVNALTPVASNDDAPGVKTSTLSFAASQGTTYRIAVDANNLASGTFRLAVGFLNAATVQDAPPGAREFTPGKRNLEQGRGVQWKIAGPSDHRIAETRAIGPDATPLFSSGTRRVGTTFTEVFPAAGQFPYRCDLHPAETGSVRVPVKSSLASGTVGQSITITWSSRAIAGYRFDVQIRHRPAGGSFGAWANWRVDQTGTSGAFVASQENGIGVYQFRSRLENQATGNRSNFSAPLEITIT